MKYFRSNCVVAILQLFIVLGLPILAFGQVQNFYVSPSGSDSNNGSQASPWATINHADAALTLGSGSGATSNSCGASWWSGENNVSVCVHVAPGTYSGRFSSDRNGNSSQRIVFISDTRWAAKVVDGQSSFSEGDIWRVNGSYQTIVGFDVSGTNSTTAIPLWGSFDHVLLNHVHNVSSCNSAPNYCTVPDGGSGIATIVNGGATDELIDSNVIHDIGPYNFCQACVASGSNGCNGVHGIYFETPRVTVTNNVIYHSAVNGIVSYHGPTNDVVANNTVFANGCMAHGGGIQLSTSTMGTLDDTSLINNIAYGNGGWGIRCDGLTSNSIVKNNNSSSNAASNYTQCITDGSDVSGSPNLVSYNANPSTPTISNGQVAWSDADYHLTTASTMLTAGTTNCASGGISPCAPSTDFTGANQSSPPSVGVYAAATGGTGGSTPPSPPTGLVATVQ